jgi:hypothetical protein
MDDDRVDISQAVLVLVYLRTPKAPLKFYEW